MRSFFSPGERHLLASLPEGEREVVEALMNELDARLEEDMERDGQTSLFDQVAA